jgi:hypothetical protein
MTRIFGLKRGEVTGEWRKLHKEELNDLYSSPNIDRVINREEWGGWGKWFIWQRGEVYARLWWGNPRERDRLENPGLDGRIIIRWIFRKWNVGAWTGSSRLRIWRVGGHF